MIGGETLGGFSIASAPILSALTSFAANTARLVILARINFRTGNLNSTTSGGLGSEVLGGFVLAGGEGDPGSADITTYKFSDRGYTTLQSDVPADEWYEGRLSHPLSWRREALLSPENNNSGRQSGFLDLIDNDGELDSTLTQAEVVGQDIEILIGEEGASIDDFVTILLAVAESAVANADGTLRINLIDATYLADGNALTSFYAGTTGYEGDAALTGTPKPKAYGELYNIEPVLVDSTNLIYQIHDGSIQSIDEVYDNGADQLGTLTDEGDTTDLTSGSTSGGAIRTDLTNGLFQLGTAPSGRVTVDVHGDNDGGYVNTVADIAYRVYNRAGLGSRWIDTGSVAEVAADVSGAAGFFIKSQRSARGAVDELLRGIGAGQHPKRNGKIRFWRRHIPVVKDVKAEFDKTNILTIRKITPPSALHPPIWQRTIGYKKNWTIQDGDGLAGSVTSAEKRFLAQHWANTTYDNDATVTVKHINAQAPEVLGSNLVNKTDADTLATFLLSLDSPDPWMFEITVFYTEAIHLEMGDDVLLTWPRWQLSTGKPFLAFPVLEDLRQRQISLILWGQLNG